MGVTTSPSSRPTSCSSLAEDHLLIRVTAPDESTLTTIREVVGSHLERFGRRNELTVAWEERSDG